LHALVAHAAHVRHAATVLVVARFATPERRFGGVMFLPLVLVFAWLSTRFEGTGGPVLYGKAAFGSFA
jgi:hypothetical protein